MKSFRILLTSAIMILTLTSSTYAGEPAGTTAADLRDRVLELVEQSSAAVSEETHAIIEFRLNQVGRIEVVKIYAEDTDLNTSIKESLNSKDSEMIDFVPGQSYFIEIKFINES